MSVVAQLVRYYPKFVQIKVHYSVQQNILPTPLPSHEQLKYILTYLLNTFITVLWFCIFFHSSGC